MTYLQALNLLIKTYKATKGYLPKGLDMLKLKMKARQKVIDAKKVIQFPPERITNPFKARPPKQLARYEGRGEGIKKLKEKGLAKTEIMMKQEGIPVTVKGKTTTMTPDGILKMLMGKGKGKDVKIGQAPKTTKRKPAVDPKLTQEENIKRIMAENKAAAKRLQEKMNKPEKSLGEKLKDYKGDPDAMREGGIISLANGGLTNISQTYDNNPTLQAQYPNKQDYLDLFAQQTTTTTPEVAAIPETTTSTIAPINPIKPIIPIPQSSGDSGGITTIQPRAPKNPLTFRESMAQLNLERGVPVEEEEISFFDKIKQFSPTYQFMKAGKQLKDRGQQAIEDFFAAREAAKAAEVARIARQNLAASMGSDAGPGEGAGTFGASVNEATGARGSGTGFSDYS